ncbi:hypothetical protein RHGRI_002237 [Rhododendron griersonianum]|uniref:Protein FAR1-RELATED SEQUENCE n=1 Tax=Rhododendron griersonianum TaxID=479676 RepID=A0AAV6LS19_9ERIC|nr:hypothetical protein RHGRI_002237 [Rhododendron griersonianum]
MASSSNAADIVLRNDCSEPESVDDPDALDLIQNETQQPAKSFVYSGPVEPCEGMVFDELEDAETCYKAYARRKGFSIRKSHTRLSNKDKSLIGVEFSCSREGYHRPSYRKKYKNFENRAETMIGCKALMRLRKDEGKWVVSKFLVEHNHELCSPESTPLLPGHRKITRAQKNLLDVLNVSGIAPAKIMSVLRESGVDPNYEKALDERYQSEKERDVETRTAKAILKTCYKIEAEAAKVYCRKSFLLFQEELFSSQKHKACRYREEGTIKTYRVLPYGKPEAIYEVVFDGVEKKATCSCHMFEFVGIVCRHILTVFVKKNVVDCLPQRYVLQRWTMNAMRHGAHEIQGPQISPTLMRNSLMIEFLKVVEEGQKSQRKHHHLTVALRKAHSELLAMDDECRNF